MFGDVVCAQHFDAHWHILKPFVGARSGHRDVFFDRGTACEFDDDGLLLIGLKVHRRGRWCEAALHDHNVSGSGRNRDRHDTGCIRLVSRAVDHDICVSDRTRFATDFNTESCRLSGCGPGGDRHQGTENN
jgi:hypothetical protein